MRFYPNEIYSLSYKGWEMLIQYRRDEIHFRVVETNRMQTMHVFEVLAEPDLGDNIEASGFPEWCRQYNNVYISKRHMSSWLRFRGKIRAVSVFDLPLYMSLGRLYDGYEAVMRGV